MAVLALCWLAASVARAHNQPPPIELWGPFLPETQTCLRVISRATHACFDTVLSIEQRCQDAQARGEPCDRDAADAQVQAATHTLRTTLTGICELGQLTELSYIGFFDAEADLDNACVTQARAAVAAAYAPARSAASSPSADCMAASAAYGRKVMWYALQRETPVMERIATRLFTAEEKQASIQRSDNWHTDPPIGLPVVGGREGVDRAVQTRGAGTNGKGRRRCRGRLEVASG